MYTKHILLSYHIPPNAANEISPSILVLKPISFPRLVKLPKRIFLLNFFAVFDFIQIILNSMNAVTWGYLFIPTRDLNFRPYNFALFESSATYECKWYSVQNKGIRFPFSLSSGKRQFVFLSKWYYRIIVHRSQKNQWRFGEYKNMRKRIEQTICYQSYFMI